MLHVELDLASEGLQKKLSTTLDGIIPDTATVIAVHNAANLVKDSVRDVEPGSLRDVLEVNVVAPTILNQALIPRMGPDSAILYVGSTLSEKAVPGSLSYVASKHAVVGLMRATCQDLMGTGIHTACICPGFTDTEMLRTHLIHDDTVLDEIKGMTSANRLIVPEEIAEILYAAATSPVFNGAVLHANMGQKER